MSSEQGAVSSGVPFSAAKVAALAPDWPGFRSGRAVREGDRRDSKVADVLFTCAKWPHTNMTSSDIIDFSISNI